MNKNKKLKTFVYFLIFSTVIALGLLIVRDLLVTSSNDNSTSVAGPSTTTSEIELKEFTKTNLEADLNLTASNTENIFADISSQFPPGFDSKLYFYIRTSNTFDIYSLNKDNKTDLIKKFIGSLPDELRFFDDQSYLFKTSDPFDEYIYFERPGMAPVLIYKTIPEEKIEDFYLNPSENLIYIILSDRATNSRIIAINPNTNNTFNVYEGISEINTVEIFSIIDSKMQIRNGPICQSIDTIQKTISGIECDLTTKNRQQRNLINQDNKLLVYEVNKSAEPETLIQFSSSEILQQASVFGDKLLYLSEKSQGKTNTDNLVVYDISSSKKDDEYADDNLMAPEKLILFDSEIYVQTGNDILRLKVEKKEGEEVISFVSVLPLSTDTLIQVGVLNEVVGL